MKQACIRLGGALLVGAAPVAARAAPVLHLFSIPSKPAAEALVDFARQADISIGNIGGCPGRAAALHGRYTVAEGLSKLLARTGCAFEMVDAGAVKIVGVRAPPKPKPPPVLAGTPPAPVPTPADEVIVTAMRRVLPENRAPSNISVAAASGLDIVGARDARDAVRQVSGVAMTNLGMGRDKILIRGLSDGSFTGRTQSTVGSFLDQTPITYNAPDPDLFLADIDRIEVLKGPQGALYGGGSLGGVFRIVTRRPMLDDASLDLRVERDITQSAAPGSVVEGVANLPLVEGRAAVRAVAYSELKGGYFDDVSLSRTNVDRTRRSGGRLALGLDLGPGWSLELGAARQEIRSADAQYSTPSSNTRFSRRIRANRIAEDHTNRFSQVSATVEGEGGWGRFQSATAFVHHDFSSRYDASRILPSDQSGGGALVGAFDEPSQTDMIVQDANLVSPTGRRMQWLVGLFAMRSQEDTHPTLAAVGATSGTHYELYREARRDHRNEVALYGEVSYALDPAWTVALGGRAFRTGIRTISQVVAVAPWETRDFEGKTSLTSVSPRLSVSYSAPSGALFYGLVSQGYRAGGFNTGGVLAPVRWRSFSPDRLWNIEFGAKLDLLKGRLRLRSAVFYDSWKNIQTDQFGSDGLSFTRNIGDGGNWGIEAEARFQASRRFYLQVNGLFSRAELDRAVAAGGRPPNALPDVPNATFNATAIYERPVGRGRTLRLGAEAAYTGRAWLTFDRGSPTTEAYVTGQVFAEIESGRWTFSAMIDNPTNSSANTFAYGNPFSLGDTRQVTPLRPRTIRFTLSTGF